MKIIDIVKNEKIATFSHYCGGNLYYSIDVDGSTYLFNINTDPKEVGTSDFNKEMKAITLMRWIRKCINSGEFIKIK